MLSKKDILKELGKGLNIHPLNLDNIKENSINVTISEYAWTQKGGTVYWYGKNVFSVNKTQDKIEGTYNILPKHKAIITDTESNKKYLMLFPHQSTIIETLEVIGIGRKIGGAVHSKVGLVLKGIGDTGTMLGPGYCGHLMITLHNITDDVIALEVGTTFVSLTFDYLKTPTIRESSTSSSHYNKLLEYGLELDVDDGNYFEEDWKATLGGIKSKMEVSDAYKGFKQKHPDDIWMQIKEYMCLRNILLSVLAITGLIILGVLAKHLDKGLTEPIWMDRYFNVIIVAICGVIFKIYGSLFRK